MADRKCIADFLPRASSFGWTKDNDSAVANDRFRLGHYFSRRCVEDYQITLLESL